MATQLDIDVDHVIESYLWEMVASGESECPGLRLHFLMETICDLLDESAMQPSFDWRWRRRGNSKDRTEMKPPLGGDDEDGIWMELANIDFYIDVLSVTIEEASKLEKDKKLSIPIKSGRILLGAMKNESVRHLSGIAFSADRFLSSTRILFRKDLALTSEAVRVAAIRGAKPTKKSGSATPDEVERVRMAALEMGLKKMPPRTAIEQFLRQRGMGMRTSTVSAAMKLIWPQ